MTAFRPVFVPLLALALVACGRAPAPAAAPTVTTPSTTAPASAASTAAAAPSVPAVGLGAFRVVDVVLGSAVDASQQVTAAQTVFAAKDAIYASVLTSGAHPGLSLSAKWTRDDGLPIALSQQALVPDGPLAVAFRVANPAGWPAGHYRVTIAADGQVLQTREFEVR